MRFYHHHLPVIQLCKFLKMEFYKYLKKKGLMLTGTHLISGSKSFTYSVFNYTTMYNVNQ